MARCEMEDEGRIEELPILEGGPRRIPTDTILAEAGMVIERFKVKL